MIWAVVGVPARVGAGGRARRDRVTIAEAGPPAGPPFLAAVRRISLREEIVEALGDDLVTGRLTAGASLTVNETARRFGVSATPVREALIHLAAQGLLEGGHHRGFQVATFAWSDYIEILECRRLVQVPLIRRIARELPEDRVPWLRAVADRMDAAGWSGDVTETATLDRQFWGELDRWCGNRRSADILAALRIQSWMFLAPYLRAAAEPVPGWRRYRELADRIAAREAEAAQELVRDHSTAGRLIAERVAESARP
jgi:DNA-binding GntR family transcriptional regulator